MIVSVQVSHFLVIDDHSIPWHEYAEPLVATAKPQFRIVDQLSFYST